MTPYAVPWLLTGLYLTVLWVVLLVPVVAFMSLWFPPGVVWRLYWGLLKDAWRWDP